MLAVRRRIPMDFDHILGWFIHTVSGSAIIAAIVGFLPVIFAVAPFLYYCLLLSRDPTVQRWLARRREHRINQLKLKVKELERKNGSPD